MQSDRFPRPYSIKLIVTSEQRCPQEKPAAFHHMPEIGSSSASANTGPPLRRRRYLSIIGVDEMASRSLLLLLPVFPLVTPPRNFLTGTGREERPFALTLMVDTYR